MSFFAHTFWKEENIKTKVNYCVGFDYGNKINERVSFPFDYDIKYNWDRYYYW